MESRRVRFLFFLVLLIFCAQILEIGALFALAESSLTNPQTAVPFDLTAWMSAVFWTFASSAGPFFAFAVAGLIAFRQSYWAMWCLTLCASAYALLVFIGLLGEYGMAREAVAAATRGGRYMNCAGHPRLFMILFAVPVAGGSVLISGAVLAVEETIHAVSSPSKQGDLQP